MPLDDLRDKDEDDQVSPSFPRPQTTEELRDTGWVIARSFYRAQEQEEPMTVWHFWTAEGPSDIWGDPDERLLSVEDNANFIGSWFKALVTGSKAELAVLVVPSKTEEGQWLATSIAFSANAVAFETRAAVLCEDGWRFSDVVDTPEALAAAAIEHQPSLF